VKHVRAVPAAVATGTIVAMEGVSYASHRWLMHGPAFGWHRSHHAPPQGRWEKNDRFPVTFSLLGIGAFAAAAVRPGLRPLRWIGGGATAYGAAYLLVHEVVIHARVLRHRPRSSYLRWLRDRHRIHHLYGGEPYGMLLPFVPRSLREQAERDAGEVLERRTRQARIRL
jgi:beta-carotene 3-hydroxylase